MSKIEVDQVDPQSGTTLTLGTSGDTVSVPSGVTLANAGTVTGIPASAISSGTIATARLGSGTASSSTFLRGDQTYAAALGVGKVLQVVFATTVAQVDNNTTSYTDTDLTASITPSATSSKIYVIVNQANKLSGGDNEAGSVIKILRDSTTIYGGHREYENFLSIGGASSVQRYDRNNLNFLDTPSSTSSLTYKTQARAYTAGDVISCQPEGIKSTITLMEIAG